MTILENAINSIEIGVEDYVSKDHRRSISAVRNITAGILLLYKEKLCQLSPKSNPELLIKQNIRPIRNDIGEIVFNGKGNRTVDVQAIKERFKSLNVTVDWGRFDEILELRNDIEHYYSTQTGEAIREIVAKSFILIRDFVSQNLGRDPQELLGYNTWEELLKVSEVYVAEKRLCDETLKYVDWKYGTVKQALKHLHCIECFSDLIEVSNKNDKFPNVNLHCKSCDSDFEFEQIAEVVLDNYIWAEAVHAQLGRYRDIADECPICLKQTFVNEDMVCIACGHIPDHLNCQNCGVPLQLDDQEYKGFCYYCYALSENF